MTEKNILKINSDVYAQARACQLCRAELPLAPKPVFQASPLASIVIIGQAPGIKAHDSNKPWNDTSGDRLRTWLGIEEANFYDETFIALVPMGFCYPGKGKSGDLPPMKVCAPTWHDLIFEQMQIKLTLLIGQYAQDYYLHDKRKLTERVKDWQNYLPDYIVLPHPSPRNNIWLKRNAWFEQEVIPELRKRVQKLISRET